MKPELKLSRNVSNETGLRSGTGRPPRPRTTASCLTRTLDSWKGVELQLSRPIFEALAVAVDENDVLTFQPYYIGTLDEILDSHAGYFTLMQSDLPGEVFDICKDSIELVARASEHHFKTQETPTVPLKRTRHGMSTRYLKIRDDTRTMVEPGDTICSTVDKHIWLEYTMQVLLCRVHLRHDLYSFIKVFVVDKRGGHITSPWDGIQSKGRITIRVA